MVTTFESSVDSNSFLIFKFEKGRRGKEKRRQGHLSSFNISREYVQLE